MRKHTYKKTRSAVIAILKPEQKITSLYPKEEIWSSENQKLNLRCSDVQNRSVSQLVQRETGTSRQFSVMSCSICKKCYVGLNVRKLERYFGLEGLCVAFNVL